MSAYIIWLAPIIAIASFALSLWNTFQLWRRDYRQQAEQVTAWFGPYDGEQDNEYKIYRGLCIKNASNQMIYDLIAEVVGLQGSVRKTAVDESDERNREYGAMVGNVPPGDVSTRINYGGGGMHKRFGIEIAFQDAGGRYWLRRGNGKLERINKHPVDLYRLQRPISWEN